MQKLTDNAGQKPQDQSGKNSIDNNYNNNDNKRASFQGCINNADLETGTDVGGKATSITISDIIGEFGLYQLSVTILAFIRYVVVATMTNTGPLIAPDVDFWCTLPESTSALVIKPANMTMEDYLRDRCQVDLQNGTTFECTSWTYNHTTHGITLTDSFDLVCKRDWLRSAFQSTISVGVVVASVIWGSFSDRHGRNLTTKICFIVSLISGLVSYLASDYLMYTISRSLCSFGDLGVVVCMTTTLIETLGNKYRGPVSIIVYTGWALGVMIMPEITSYFMNYRQLMLFLVVIHLLTLPWLLSVGESVRWSMVNGRSEDGRLELRRIVRWNRCGNEKSLEVLDDKFEQFKEKFVMIAEKNKVLRDAEEANSNRCQIIILTMFGGLMKVNQLFHSRELAITTVMLIWTTFNSELLYMLFILINSDIGDNAMLNYAIGGVMEILATILSIVIISSVTRKLSLSATLVTISLLCLSLAFTHDNPWMSVWNLNGTKLAISTLSSLIYVVTTEMFPTNLRQTGFGFTGTVGSFGAVLAPFVRTELVNLIGMTHVLLIVFILPLTAALLIPFFLRETKGLELPDDIDEIESENLESTLRSRNSSLSKRPPTMVSIL